MIDAVWTFDRISFFFALPNAKLISENNPKIIDRIELR